MSAPLEFFRTEQFRNEIAQHLSVEEIDLLIKWGVEAINQAYVIKENNLYNDYEVTPKQLDFDIKAFDHNINELQEALSIKQGFQILEMSNGLKFGIFSN